MMCQLVVNGCLLLVVVVVVFVERARLARVVMVWKFLA